jgi:hypothetical protein
MNGDEAWFETEKNKKIEQLSKLVNLAPVWTLAGN